MKVLIAEDDAVSRLLLQATLSKWGYEVVVAVDGLQAWQLLEREDAPQLAVLDWMMPGMDGIEICRRLRAAPHAKPVYLLLLTAKGLRKDIVAGLTSGADDYVTKPFDHEELRARVQVGVRIIELQRRLAGRVRELETALNRVKQLQGLLPICSYCKKIRNDRNYWEQVDNYVSQHSEVQFSHSVCPECFEYHVKPQLDMLKRNASGIAEEEGPLTV
jgi:sigma-B regulation protein RsbU (phosphoserine phosphatase)